MNFNKILDLKGINFLFLAAAMFLNLFWTLTVASMVAYLAAQNPEGGRDVVQVIVFVFTFLGPLLIAWMVGRLAGDNRGPTYGVYGSVGSVMVLFLTALPTGLIGVMLIIAAVAGGLNGGLLSLSR